jgi:beta-galactosidase
MMNKNLITGFFAAIIALTVVSAMAYTVPANNRMKYNLDIGWQLNVGDITGAQATAFNDASWKTISLPYCWNQDDAFAKSVTTGIAWYRKHFSIPATYAGSKVFLEFEEIRQAGVVYCNGTQVGLSENGVMASGFDLTPYVKIDGTDNVIAVKTDNSYSYVEVSSGTGFQWNRGSYTTNFGGITQNAYLHVTPKCYQTLPLVTNLKTVGTYIYGKNYVVSGGASATTPMGSADITATSEVKNESSASQTVSYQVDIVDPNGNLVKTLTGAGQAIAAGATATVTATGNVTGLNLWSVGHGYLYDVYTMLLVGGTVTDVVKTRTGFRKMDYSNGIAKINERMLHVKGFAWRSQNPWPALGDGVPAWMVSFQDSMMLAIGGNTVRPMQVCALRSEIEAGDRMGLSYAMPAGDAEGDVTGRQWDQRTEVMRDAIVYSRNNPCVFWFEGGNSDITDPQMQQMVDTLAKYDPNGGRVIGCRGMLDSKVAQYGGEMMYVDKSSYKPMWMMEYSRNESPRRWWDQYSPPEYHVNDVGTASVPGYNMNQDAYILEECNRWYEYWTERPGTGNGTGTRYNQGGAKIEMCDGTTFARSSENYRRSGVVDAMRLPKDSYGAFKVFWDGWVEVDNKDVYIVGHWTYPATSPNGAKDTVYVVSNCDKVELFVNNVSKGFGTQKWKFLFTFPNVLYAAGTVKAVGYNSAGVQMAQDQISTAGAAAAIRLTPRVSPAGLLATGADIALFDAEVIDASGNRCPTASNSITYAVTGPGEYRGGMAGNHTGNYILSTSLPVECGISRVSVRASSTPGAITLAASSSGLTGASATVTSTAVAVANGLTTVMPNDGLPLNMPPLPPYQLDNPAPTTLKATTTAANGANTYDDDETTSWSGASITYNLASAQQVSSVHIKFTTFKNDNSWKVSVGGTQVWSGTSAGGLGYADATFTPASGSTVTIAAASGNLSIYETEIYGPGVVGVKTAVKQSAIPVNLIKKYPGRVDIILPDETYAVNLVDLFGRVVFANHHSQKGVSGMVSFATNKLAKGVYVVDVLKGASHVQKDVVFVQ